MGGCSSKQKIIENSKIKIHPDNKIQPEPIKNDIQKEPSLNKTEKKQENHQNNLPNIDLLMVNKEKEDSFSKFMQVLKAKTCENFEWNDVEIIDYQKKSTYESVKVFHKKSSKIFVYRLYVFEKITTINEEIQKEIMKLDIFNEEIDKLALNFVCKFHGVKIQEKYIAFIKEYGKISLIDYLNTSSNSVLEEINYYILKLIANLMEIEEKIKDKTTILIDTLCDVILSEENLKISFDCEIDSENRFFQKLKEVLSKNSLIQKNKNYTKLKEIINDITERKLLTYTEINKKLLTTNIAAKKSTLKLDDHHNDDEILIKVYLDSANFFQSMNENEQMKYYSIKAYDLIKKQSSSSSEYEIQCLNLLTSNTLMTNEIKPNETNSNENINAETSISSNNLALNYTNTEELKMAEETLLKSLEISNKDKTEEDEETAVILNNLGGVYFNQSDLNKAEEYYKKSLKIREKIPNYSNENFGMNLNNLGLVFKKMNNNKKAAEFYKKSIEVLNKYPENSNYMSSVYNNLGGLYHGLRKFKTAEKYYDKSFALRLERINEDPLAFAQSLNNLGTLYKDSNELAKGKIYLEKSYEIYEKLEKKGTFDKGICLNNLASSYFEMGNKNKAKEFLLKANVVWGKLYGEQYALVIENSKKIKEIN